MTIPSGSVLVDSEVLKRPRLALPVLPATEDLLR